jgi:hypothetical protein
MQHSYAFKLPAKFYLQRQTDNASTGIEAFDFIAADASKIVYRS